MKFVGIITHIIDRSGVSKNGDPFNAYQFRVEEKTISYPQSILLDCFGDKFKNHIVGQYIEAEFNLRCDIYNDKLFGKCSAWKITVLAGPEPVDNRPLYNGHEDPLRSFEQKTSSPPVGAPNQDINAISPAHKEESFESEIKNKDDLPF